MDTSEEKYKKTLEYLLYQSGIKDGNIPREEMELIARCLNLCTLCYGTRDSENNDICQSCISDLPF